MTINSINNPVNAQQIKNLKNENIDKNKDTKNKNVNLEVKNDKEIVDKFEKSQVEKDVTYGKPKFKRDEGMIAKIQAEVDQVQANLKNLVKALLEKQGMTFKDLRKDGPDIKIDEETRLEAQKAIDEGGDLSIENVSDRLVNFAKAVSGGDKSKLELMRNSIEKGFKEAEKAFGGKLPDISHKTFERTMEKLDQWDSE